MPSRSVAADTICKPMFNPIHPPAHWLKLLQEQPCALDWPERSTLPKEASRWTALHPEDESAQRLLELLSADPKWEVRRAVAESLGSIPEPLYRRMAPTLSKDVHYYVSAAAKFAIERREPPDSRARGPRYKGQRQRVREIQNRYGEAAARMAEKLADQRANEILRAVVHDLKVIMAPLETGKSMIARSAKQNPEVQGGLRILDHAITDLSGLASSVGAFARPCDLETETADLVQVAREAVDAAKVVLRKQEQDIDPVKVTRSALANAASIAAMLLTTEALVVEKKEEEEGDHGHGHSHGPGGHGH